MSYKKFKTQPDGSLVVKVYKEGSNLHILFPTLEEFDAELLDQDETSDTYRLTNFNNTAMEYFLWRTASNVEVIDALVEEVLTEGPNDPHIFKAIFLIGGPGSGKSYVGQQLISGSGLKYVNVDKFFEIFAKQQNVDPTDLLQDNPEELTRAGKLTGKQQDLFINGRLGLMIDSTGRRSSRIQATNKLLQDMYYETMAIYVNTDVDVAIRRNMQRPRTVNIEFLKKAHMDTRNNLGLYQSLFDEMIIVDNSEDSIDLTEAWKKVQAFINAPISHQAKQWIKKQQ